MALTSSQLLRFQMVDEDLVPKQLIPLLVRVVDSKVVVVELLKLISVVGSTSPGDKHLGEDLVIRGLFQAVRENIPKRVMDEFAVAEVVVGEEGEGDVGDDTSEMLQVPTDMPAWCLELNDFTEEPLKTHKKKKKLMKAEKEGPPPLKASLTSEEEHAATKQLLRIGTFLLWRAVSSFCGSISMSVGLSSTSSPSSPSLMTRRRGGAKQDGTGVLAPSAAPSAASAPALAPASAPASAPAPAPASVPSLLTSAEALLEIIFSASKLAAALV
jgi:hypothetical protein